MSYKRQLQAHYRNFEYALRTLSAPAWITGLACRSILSILVVFLSVAYIVRINSASTTGFQMHNLEKQVASLDVEVQNMNIQIADAGSMYNLEKHLADLHMVKADKTQYLTRVSAVVAKR